MRTAYRCRAYPDEMQQAALRRTFGCVRVVWNREVRNARRDFLHRCPSCGTRHDRDINAAKNILAASLAVARGSPGDACGADIRHSGSSRVRSAAKQEPRPARAGIPVLQGRK
jgi:transposase